MAKSAYALTQQVRQMYERADAAGRELTAKEREDAAALLDEAKAQKRVEDQFAQLEGHGAPWERGADSGRRGQGLGDQFVSSKQYRSISDPSTRSEIWSSGGVELSTKGTVLTTPGTGLTPAAYVPGVVETLFQRLYVSDLMPQPQAAGNPVRFVQETTTTNAAAPTAEGATKPESAILFGEVAEPLRKIATVLPISDELLEDAPQISAYLNARLQLFVQIQEEAQVLLGNGTAPKLAGFISPGNRTIGTYARGTLSNEEAIFRAANGTRGSSQLDPDTVIINPTNWQTIRLAKDSSGQFYGGGPFSIGPYGGPQGPASSGFQLGESLWDMKVVVTSNITVGSALLGAFATGAAVHRRGGLRVEATNSHGSYFAQNLTAIRAEERLALAVYRPTGFTVVTGLN